MDEIKKLKQRRSYLINKVGEGLVKGWAPTKMMAIVKDMRNVEINIKNMGGDFKVMTDEVFSLEYWEGKVRLGGQMGKARSNMSKMHEATPIPENERAYYTVKMVYSAKDHRVADKAQQLMHKYLTDEWSAVEQDLDMTIEGSKEVTIYKYRVAGTPEDMQIIEAAYGYFKVALLAYEPSVKSEGIWCTKE